MTSISGTIPNLIGGVSQQPAATRLDNTAEALENAVCSVVTGLRKRPPFQLASELTSVNPVDNPNVDFHLWERPGGKTRVIVTASDGITRVFRLDGTEENVHISSAALAYLGASGTPGRIGYCAVGDAMYLYNRTVTVESEEDAGIGGFDIIQQTTTITVTSPITTGASILLNGSEIASSTAESTSEVVEALALQLDGDASASYTLDGNTFTFKHPPTTEYTATGDVIFDVTSATVNTDSLVTVVIENTSARTDWRLTRNGSRVARYDQGGADYAFDATIVARGLSRSLNRPHTLINNVLIIERESGEVWDAWPGTLTRTYVNQINQFTNLPPVEVDGRLVAVQPGPEDGADPYYVRFDQIRGTWEESRGPSILQRLKAITMPMRLQENAPGSWVLGLESWERPEVGDADTNPLPSFVGWPIEHMFLFRDRMCVLSDENVIFSQVSDYTNFFRTTVSTLREDDRMDGAVTVPGESSVKLRSALAFDGQLYLFADKAQIKLEFNDASPGQFRAVPLSNFEVSPTVKPVLLGDRAVFADAGGGVDGWSRVREYRLEAVSGTNQAEDITRQVPRFIPTGVYSFAASTAVDALHVLSRTSPDKMFRYDYYSTSEGRVQSAWNTWELPGYTFEGAGVVGRQLVVLVKGFGKRFLGFANIEDAFDPDIEDRSANLDMRLYVSGGSTVRFVPAGPEENPERLEVFPNGMRPRVYTWNGLVIVIPVMIGLYDGFEYPDYSAIDNFPYWTDQPLWAIDSVTGEPYPGSVIGDPGDPSTWRAVFPDMNLTTTEAYVGQAVGFRYKMSPVYLRDAQKTAIHDGRLQLRYLSIMYNDTVAFKVAARSPGYTPANTPVMGVDARINTSDGYLRRGELAFPGPSTVRFGKFRVPVATRGEHLDVEITDDGPFQCAFSSIEWEGSWRPKTKRISR